MLLNGGLEKAATQGMPKLPVRIANTLFVGFNHAGRLEKQNLCIRGRGLGLGLQVHQQKWALAPAARVIRNRFVGLGTKQDKTGGGF